MAVKKPPADAYWENLPDELTILNACNLLQLSESSILKCFNSGEFSAYRIGKVWRTNKEELKADIESRKNDEARRAYLLKELEEVNSRLESKIVRLA